MNPLSLRFNAGPNRGGRRPAAQQQAALPPFDPNDDYGTVHTTLPPEQNMAELFTDPAVMLADFHGVTIPGDYDPPLKGSPGAWDDAAIKAAGGVRMTSGPFAGLWVPFLAGANSTPPTMIMTPMLILYPRDVQDVCLTLHAWRAYREMIFDPEPWNLEENGQNFTDEQIVAWFQYAQSWGFRVVGWRGDYHLGVDARMKKLFDAGAVGYWIPGEEVDSQGTSEQFEAALQDVDRYIGGRVPIGVHFTTGAFDPENGGRGMGYPIGFPRETYLNNWGPYNKRVHLMLQLTGLNANIPRDGALTPAGLQGASMYYARKQVNFGGTDAGGQGGAPDSRVVMFELMPSAQLQGWCTEAEGVKRAWQVFCGTRDDARALPVAGSGCGLWYPDGTPIK